MNILSLLILGQFLATSLAQLVINGDTRVYAKYARAKALEGAALRRIVNLETSYADRSDMEYANYKKRLDAKTYKDRGSKYTVDGVPIPGNENLDSQVRVAYFIITNTNIALTISCRLLIRELQKDSEIHSCQHCVRLRHR